jgi:peptidoglycan/LPS O-acetylase OafA/YrhL
MLVIGSHNVPNLTRNGSWLAMKAVAAFSHAGYGVDVFFCLSGFLICTLLLREKQSTGTISLGRFYVRRTFRIMPPLLAYLAFVVGISFIGLLPHFTVADILSVLLFCRNYVNGGGGNWYTAQFWSLAVEEHFYLLVPLYILVLSRKWAIRSSLILIALCILIRDLEYRMGSEFGNHIDLRTETRYDGLLWGCLLAFALQGGRVLTAAKKYLTLPVILGVTVVTAILLTVLSSPPERRTIVACFIPLLIAYTMLRPQDLIGRVLESPVLRWLGTISYSLYLWQQLFLPKFEHPLPMLQTFPVTLIGPVVCAAISFYLIETPMIRLGHKLAASPGAGSVFGSKASEVGRAA